MDGDIAGMLRQVMENPQFGSMMQAVKTQMGDGDGTVDPAKMMEKLPEMMTMLGPVLRGMVQGEGENGKTGEGHSALGGNSEDGKTTEEAKEGVKEQETIGRNPGMFLFRPDSRDKRNKLLAALKPYLSPARCALVDRAMSAMQLGEILGTMAPSGKQEE